jgi:hypothetical protein
LAPTVGIAATGFCYPGGILQVFINEINKFYDCRQQQQPDRISLDQSSSTTTCVELFEDQDDSQYSLVHSISKRISTLFSAHHQLKLTDQVRSSKSINTQQESSTTE